MNGKVYIQKYIIFFHSKCNKKYFNLDAVGIDNQAVAKEDDEPCSDSNQTHYQMESVIHDDDGFERTIL